MHTEMVVKDMIPGIRLLAIIDDLADMGVKAITFSGGGEPLMHSTIVEAMTMAVGLGIDISIITNGELLTGPRAEMLAHAKWVRVSMDYVNPIQMEQFRGVKDHKRFDKILSNMEAFAKIKGDCDLGINFIVHNRNHLGLFQFAQMMEAIGVENIRFSPMWVSPGFHEYHRDLVPLVETELRAIRESGMKLTVNSTYDITSSAHSTVRSYCKCLVMQTIPVIGADQNVYACHNKAYDKSGLIGSIANQKFSDLWFSNEARQVFENFNPQAQCKHQCANDQKNIHMNDLTDMHIDNFV